MQSLAQVVKQIPVNDRALMLKEAWSTPPVYQEKLDIYALLLSGVSVYQTSTNMRDIEIQFRQSLRGTEYERMWMPPGCKSLLDNMRTPDGYYKMVLDIAVVLYQQLRPNAWEEAVKRFKKVGKELVPPELVREARVHFFASGVYFMEGVAFVIEDKVDEDMVLRGEEYPFTLEEYLARMSAKELRQRAHEDDPVKAMLMKEIVMNACGPYEAAKKVVGRLSDENKRCIPTLRRHAGKMTEKLYIDIAGWSAADVVSDMKMHKFAMIPVEVLRLAREALDASKVLYQERALFFKWRHLPDAWKKRDSAEASVKNRIRSAGSLIR